MSPTELSLADNILVIPGQGEFGKWHDDIPAEDWEISNLFYSVHILWRTFIFVCAEQRYVEAIAILTYIYDTNPNSRYISLNSFLRDRT